MMNETISVNCVSGQLIHNSVGSDRTSTNNDCCNIRLERVLELL
jgi:hypothetical protein